MDRGRLVMANSSSTIICYVPFFFIHINTFNTQKVCLKGWSECQDPEHTISLSFGILETWGLSNVCDHDSDWFRLSGWSWFRFSGWWLLTRFVSMSPCDWENMFSNFKGFISVIMALCIFLEPWPRSNYNTQIKIEACLAKAWQAGTSWFWIFVLMLLNRSLICPFGIERDCLRNVILTCFYWYFQNVTRFLLGPGKDPVPEAG